MRWAVQTKNTYTYSPLHTHKHTHTFSKRMASPICGGKIVCTTTRSPCVNKCCFPCRYTAANSRPAAPVLTCSSTLLINSVREGSREENQFSYSFILTCSLFI